VIDITGIGKGLQSHWCWKSPVLQLTDYRKRCYKLEKDLILTWRWNTLGELKFGLSQKAMTKRLD